VINYLYLKGCDINAKSILGRIALQKACYLGKFEVVLYLVNLKEIDIDALDNKNRNVKYFYFFNIL